MHERSYCKSKILIVTQTHQTICTFWYRFSALRKQAYISNGVLTMPTGTNVGQLHIPAFNGYRCTTGMKMGVEQAFTGNFNVTHTETTTCNEDYKSNTAFTPV